MVYNMMLGCMHSLCNSYCKLINTFVTQQVPRTCGFMTGSLYPSKNVTPFLLHPAAGNCHSTLCFYGFDIFQILHITKIIRCLLLCIWAKRFFFSLVKGRVKRRLVVRGDIQFLFCEQALAQIHECARLLIG